MTSALLDVGTERRPRGVQLQLGMKEAEALSVNIN
jgi:hypothetical protein